MALRPIGLGFFCSDHTDNKLLFVLLLVQAFQVYCTRAYDSMRVGPGTFLVSAQSFTMFVRLHNACGRESLHTSSAR